MSHKKDITPYNDKGQAHGNCVMYNNDGCISFKATYHNGKEIGYLEHHWNDGTGSWYKMYYII